METFNNLPRQRLLIVLWLCALLLVGAYLRVHGVSDYYYNPDELSNIAIAKGKDVREVIAFSKFETHPPYPAILRHFLIQISDAPEFLRGESAFFGLLCILVYYGIGKNAGGTLTGCIAAFLVTFSYGNILQSQVVRNYTMLAFFLGCTYWCYQRFMSTQDKRYAMAYTVMGLLSLMTHYSAIFMCFSVYAVSAFFMLRDKHYRTLQLWTLANLIIAAYFGYQYFTQLQHNAYADYWKTQTQLLASDSVYNTFSFRSGKFIEQILSTSLYLIYTSHYAYINYLVMSMFCISVAVLFFEQRRLLAQAIFAIILEGSLIALNIYPYAYGVGGRHSTWILPYAIIALSFLFHRPLVFIFNKGQPVWGIMLVAALAIAVGLYAYPADLLLTDFVEHPLTNSEEKALQQFMDSLTSQDLIITGGLGTISLLPDITQYYTSLKMDTHENWFFTAHRGNTTVVYTHFNPPLVEGKIWSRFYTLRRYKEAGVLDNITTLWFLDSGWSHIWDGFIDCMVRSGNAVVRPPIDPNTLGPLGFVIQPKFIGIRMDVLLTHAYECK